MNIPIADSASMKKCVRCGENRPNTVEYFYWKNKAEGRLSARCKWCQKARNKTYRRTRTPEQRKAKNRLDSARPSYKNAKLKYKYGITLDTYSRMFIEQQGLCAICKRKPNGKGSHGALGVDHDHKTGAVRALLCNRCNGALGLINEDTATIISMAAYVHKYRTEFGTRYSE